MNWPINRRDFLIKQLKGALYLTAGAAGLCLPKSVIAGVPAISTVKLPRLSVAKGSPGPATRAALGLLGGMKSFVKPGDKVVIKPNLSFPHRPESATNTHPLVTRELVAMCKEAGASRIRVLDNPTQRAERCIKTTKDALSMFNQDIVHALVKKDFYKPVSIPTGKYFKKTDVMKDVLAADVLIAAPVAKSHSMTGVSLSMKGMMGLIWNRQTMHADYDLDPAIVDLCSLLKPDLVVVDLIRVLSTNGPWGPGRVIRMDTVIASNDMVAADAKTVAMCEWYGQRFESRQVDHIRIAHERGLGRMDVENLHVKHIEA
ncbi:MAG: DUF362 domain-containing protein [Desulfobacterales bacterium]|nr:MAG: DUF362 domain-containing protein [Desulfobacterales bacterium]